MLHSNIETAVRIAASDKMINAVLVFNNNGQPRLTKFYTQIVSMPSFTKKDI